MVRFLLLTAAFGLASCVQAQEYAMPLPSQSAGNKQSGSTVIDPLGKVIDQGHIQCSVFDPPSKRGISRSPDGSFNIKTLETVSVIVQQRCYPIIIDLYEHPNFIGVREVKVRARYNIDENGIVGGVRLLDDLAEPLRSRVILAAEASRFGGGETDAQMPAIEDAVVTYTLKFE